MVSVHSSKTPTKTLAIVGNATKKMGVQIFLHYSDPASLSLESEEGWLAHMGVPFFSILFP